MSRPRTHNAAHAHGRNPESRWHLVAGVYLPVLTLDAMQGEANRLERSLSQIAQTAWEIAKDELRSMPGAAEQIERARFLSRRGR